MAEPGPGSGPKTRLGSATVSWTIQALTECLQVNLPQLAPELENGAQAFFYLLIWMMSKGLMALIKPPSAHAHPLLLIAASWG